MDRNEIALRMEAWPHDISPDYVASALDLPRCPDDPRRRLRWWVDADARYRYLQADALIAFRDGVKWTT